MIIFLCVFVTCRANIKLELISNVYLSNVRSVNMTNTLLTYLLPHVSYKVLRAKWEENIRWRDQIAAGIVIPFPF